MASFVPTSRFNSVDLPAFGRPMNETNPDFIAPPDEPRFFLCVFRVDRRRDLGDPHLVDTAALGIENLNAEAIDVKALADGRHAADLREQVAADGLESFALDLNVQSIGQLVDVHLAADDEAAVAFVDDRLGLDVVLVAN